MAKEKITKIVVEIPVELRDELLRIASEEDITFQEIVVKLLEYSVRP